MKRWCRRLTEDKNSKFLLAEFAALRSEITTHLSLQGQFMSISIALFGIAITVAEKYADLRNYVSFASVPFSVLGLLYADSAARTMRAARYINVTLVPKLTDGSIMTWENYIRQDPPGHPLMRILDYLRWVLFLGPAGLFAGMGFQSDKYVWLAGWDLALLVFCAGVLLYVHTTLSRKVSR